VPDPPHVDAPFQHGPSLFPGSQQYHFRVNVSRLHIFGALHSYIMSPHFRGAEEFPPFPANEKSSKDARTGEAPRAASHANCVANDRILVMCETDRVVVGLCTMRLFPGRRNAMRRCGTAISYNENRLARTI
jgi:hypothetical protein